MTSIWRTIFRLIPILAVIFTAGTAVMADETQNVSLDDLQWLVGQWKGEGLGGTCEEIWNPQSAGTMVGTFKMTKNDTVRFYEIMTIAPREGQMALNVKHFNSDLTGWEQKDEVISFPLLYVSDNEIAFDGIVYRKLSKDSLQIVIKMKSKDGTFHEVLIDCKRF